LIDRSRIDRWGSCIVYLNIISHHNPLLKPPNLKPHIPTSGGVDGPLFDEAVLLDRALQKWGGPRGLLRRRLEADRLHAELLEAAAATTTATTTQGGAGAGDMEMDDKEGDEPPLPLSLAARLARARRAELAAEGRIAWTGGALVDTREAERWWTLPAALAGFNLRLADVMGGDVPQRRYEPPHR
jgi:hypothetical protein